MIVTSRQLKDKIRNISGGESRKAQTLIRNFMMERFLERISLSEYREKFVLKGGMLVASLVGLDMRATMDIDTTVRALPLTLPEAEKIICDIINIKTQDTVSFSVINASDIMAEHDYPGIRFMLKAEMDRIRQDIKIDISTGDVITPAAIGYSYPLMFEERSILLLSYNVETLLAEKLETVMSRGTVNTRMRDFYDIHVILGQKDAAFQSLDLKKAFEGTCKNRNTTALIPQFNEIMEDIIVSDTMEKAWDNYRDSSFYVGELTWEEVAQSAAGLAEVVSPTQEMTGFEEENEQDSFEMTMN